MRRGNRVAESPAGIVWLIFGPYQVFAAEHRVELRAPHRPFALPGPHRAERPFRDP